MPSILWKYISILLFLQMYGPEITTESGSKEALSSNEKGKGSISSAMSTMLNQLQEQYKNSLPADTAKEVMQRLESIAFDHENIDAFCTMKFGLRPLDILNLINDVAQLTKMPRHLQNIVEKTITVIDTDSTIAESTPFTSDGKVFYILTAACRNSKINNISKHMLYILTNTLCKLAYVKGIIQLQPATVRLLQA